MKNKTEAHTLLLSADYVATEKLKFDGGVVCNWSKSQMQSLSADYYEGKKPASFGYDHALSFDVWEDNSDLKVEEFEYYLGCTFDYNETLSINLNASYTDYNDDDPYLYDTDGDLLLVNAGLTFRF